MRPVQACLEREEQRKYFELILHDDGTGRKDHSEKLIADVAETRLYNAGAMLLKCK